jgi:hypothetical protein
MYLATVARESSTPSLSSSSWIRAGATLGLVIVVYTMVSVSLYCFYRKRPSGFSWFQHALLECWRRWVSVCRCGA